MKTLFTAVLSVLALFGCLITAAALPGFARAEPDIPDTLKPWTSWVLHDKAYYACPRAANDADSFFCVWPGILDLDVTDTGGSFTQTLTVFAAEKVPLPGDLSRRPLTVTVDGKPAPVVMSGGVPSVFLDPGTHSLAGRFAWTRLPAFFPVPDYSALISLRVNGSIQPGSAPDEQNRIWLHRNAPSAAPAQEADRLDTAVYRRLVDDRPAVLETRLDVSVAGSKRRETLSLSLPAPSRIIAVESPLPARLLEDGTLWVDVKAGSWSITVRAVIDGPLTALGPLNTPYGEEIWAFKPRPELRMVTIDGVPAVDPGQTGMPDKWKPLSAYRITDQARITFNESRRGCTDVSPVSLSLSRTLWPDFNGKGATVRDMLDGDLSARHFLSLTGDTYTLGRLTSNGRDQLITKRSESDTGIELDRGPLSVEAVSRINGSLSGRRLDLGWNCDYTRADVTLSLPPGWSVLGVGGAKAEKGATWLNRWSMLDVFLVLIVAYGAFTLWNPGWGLLFLAGLVLMRHEELSPFFGWMALILAALLIRFRSGTSDKRGGFLKGVYTLFLVLVCLHGALFALAQVRGALFPHLPAWTLPSPSFDYARTEAVMTAPEFLTESGSRAMDALEETEADMMPVMPRSAKAAPAVYRLTSENTVTQTGPAIPTWDGRTITLHAGQVPADHAVSVRLMSPLQNTLLSFIRVLLLLVMLARVLSREFRGSARQPGRHGALACLVPATLFALCLYGTPSQARADIPSPQMLDDLAQRLIEPAPCFPDCAAVSELSLSLPDDAAGASGKQFIRMDFTVNAAVRTAIPLPSGLGTWQVYDLTLDEAPHRAMVRKDREVWALIPQGVHRISLRGLGLDRTTFRFAFPLAPARISLQPGSWEVSGLDENQQAPNGLIAGRSPAAPLPVAGDRDKKAAAEQPISGVVRVERTLTLDREWTVSTAVRRLSGSDTRTPVMVALPLIDGEMVKSDLPGLTVSETRARIALAPGNTDLTFSSALPITDGLTLAVPADADWSEVWRVKASSRWHLDAQGPPQTCETNGQYATWHPFAGEALRLSAVRLEPAEGEFFTIDAADVDYRVGKGPGLLTLTCRLRSSKARTFSIPTPEGCIVKRLHAGSRDLPVSGRPGVLDIPLPPGEQTLTVDWDVAPAWGRSFFQRLVTPDMPVFPSIDLGQEAANIRMTMHLTEPHWLVYTHGPAWGPVLLRWGLWGLVIVAAVLLGRLAGSPLGIMQWLILGLGLVSVSMPLTLVTAGWFMAMELRRTRSPVSALGFNLMQVGLIFWTGLVVFAVYQTVATGLLGTTDMLITGNGSQDGLLVWTRDRATGALPRPWVAACAVQTFQGLMLAWALWLAVHLPEWARFATGALKSDGWFRPLFFSRAGRKLK
ncbi:hypothetical protein JCM14469_39650 [Desulfatiferula olefinivorans]